MGRDFKVNLLSRRSFLAVSSVGIGGIEVLTLEGCGPATTAIVTAEVIIVPIITATISEIVKELVKMGLNRVFKSGDTLSSEEQFPGFTYRTLPAVPAGFFGKRVGNGFATPVSIHSRSGRERYVQIPENGGYWALMAGGRNSNEVFQIHVNWLRWILDSDTCNFTVNGNSGVPTECGIDGCRTLVSKQAFLDVSGNDKLLDLPIGDVSPEHANHSKPWIGCPVVQGTPEECGATSR